MFERRGARADSTGPLPGEGAVTGAHSKFVAEASRLLASSLDYETTLKRVAHIAVPELADCCAVMLTQPDCSLQQVAQAAARPDKEALLRRLAGHSLPEPPKGSFLEDI